MRGDIALGKNFAITERQNFEYRLEIFNVFSLWHSNINGGPNGGGGIQDNLQSGSFGALVPLDTNSSGQLLSEDLQSGFQRLWNPRIIQIVPGSGVRAHNVQQILQPSSACEIHSSLGMVSAPIKQSSTSQPASDSRSQSRDSSEFEKRAREIREILEKCLCLARDTSRLPQI